jgi:diphthine-ammonia ligase
MQPHIIFALLTPVHRAKDTLRKDSLDFPLIQHINLYLARMSDFPLVNAEYIKYFGSEPPTRACVGVHLDTRAGQICRLEAVGWDDKREERTRRSGLHVQGLSYWAPANIGPYSQGVVVSPLCNPTLQWRGGTERLINPMYRPIIG